MEFAWSEEQQELAATVRSLLAKRADSAAVRAAMVSETGYDESLWQTLCEQIGVAALAIPEDYDGAGFSLLESFIVLEEIGRSLAPSPLLASLVTSEALLAGADDEARTRLLPQIAAGDAAYLASRTGLQVHGAIGYTAELDLSIWLTKIRALVSAWGTPAVHRARILEGLG